MKRLKEQHGVGKKDDSAGVDVDKMTMEQLFTFLELLITYLRYNTQLLGEINTSQVMKFTCDHYLKDCCDRLTAGQVSGVYWLCRNLGPYWEKDFLQKLESKLIAMCRHEIDLQSRLEKQYDDDVPEGLQTLRVRDL